MLNQQNCRLVSVIRIIVCIANRTRIAAEIETTITTITFVLQPTERPKQDKTIIDYYIILFSVYRGKAVHCPPPPPPLQLGYCQMDYG